MAHQARFGISCLLELLHANKYPSCEILMALNFTIEEIKIYPVDGSTYVVPKLDYSNFRVYYALRIVYQIHTT